MGWVAVGAAVGLAGSVYSTNKAGQASDAQLAFDQGRYDEGKVFMDNEMAAGSQLWQQGVGNLQESINLSNRQNAQYQAESSDYKQRAKESETQMQAYFDEYLGNFQTMLGDNDQAMQDFNRRYGNIMDNIKDGIMNVSQERLSAGGREQLSLDMETLGKTFDNSMANRGLARSGLSIEADMRIQQETAQQARKIDMDSYGQAQQLQGQGIQQLNSMNQQEQGLRDQRMNINQQYGQANQQIGNVYGNQSSNFYSASQNMFGRGFNNQIQAQTNMGNAYQSLGANRIGTAGAFYSGQASNGGNGISQGFTNQSNQANADATGWAQVGGTLAADAISKL